MFPVRPNQSSSFTSMNATQRQLPPYSSFFFQRLPPSGYHATYVLKDSTPPTTHTANTVAIDSCDVHTLKALQYPRNTRRKGTSGWTVRSASDICINRWIRDVNTVVVTGLVFLRLRKDPVPKGLQQTDNNSNSNNNKDDNESTESKTT